MAGPLALLIARPEGGSADAVAVLDRLCAAKGGVSVIERDGRSRTWAFTRAASAVAAALEFREAGPFRLPVAVHIGAPALEVGPLVWPLVGPLPTSPEKDIGAPRAEDGRLLLMPEPANAFIGRESEIANGVQMLGRGGLVTLTGPGGCGKTRLALEIARAVAARYDGAAFWVDLAPLAEASSVAATAGRVMGLWLEMESDPAAALAEYLRGRRALIVLDNCEHVLEGCRDLVSQLARGGPEIQVIATSREALGIDRETVVAVAPLAVPERADQIVGSEAGRLFAERARAVRPNFVVASEDQADLLDVCRRLDGIPLALEFAAARTRLLTLAQIAAGLAEGFALLGSAESPPARQQTLEASIAWSHALCSPEEKVLFRRLAVFAGGCTLDAVEAVCSGGLLDRIGLLDVLDHLIDRSMVVVDYSRPVGRYRLLETVRDFAAARLLESDEGDPVRDRHLQYMQRLAEEAATGIPRANGLRWLPRLEDDYANLVAALSWAEARGRPAELLGLAGSLALLWEMRGRFVDGAHWLDRALGLDQQSGAQPGPLRLRALWARAHLAIYAADFRTAMSIAPEALNLADQIDDPIAAGRLRNTVGFALCYSDPAAAVTMLNASIQIGVKAGDDWTVADSTKFLTVAHLIAGDTVSGEAALTRLREVATRLGNPFFVGWCDGGIGYCQLLKGQLGAAIESFDRSIASAAEVGDPATRGIVQAWRAYALAKLGRYSESRAQATECLTRTIRQGGGLGAPFARVALGVVELAEGNPEMAATSLAEVADWCRGAGDTFSALWAIPLSAGALALAGRTEEAAAALDDALRLAGPPINNPWSAGIAIHGQGLVAEQRGDLSEAERFFHEALALQHEHGFLTDAFASLHAIAVLAARAESWLEAMRLFGATDALRDQHGLVPSAREHEDRVAMEAAAQLALGEMARESARLAGLALSLDEAVAYASRARGARGRPIHGWESLTPTEHRIVAGVTQGLTNPQIATRLFISRSTVKTHLAHVFTKLDISTRSELAAAAARRPPG